MQYTITPSIIDNAILRIAAKAKIGDFVEINDKLLALKPITWFNLPYQFNKVIDIVKEYQVEVVDGDLQDLIDDIATVSWFGYFKKVDLLVKIVEHIESL